MKSALKRFLCQFLIIIGIFIVIFVITQYSLKKFTRHGQSLIVPDFTGMGMIQAKETAEAYSLQLEIIDSIFLPNKPRGSVFKQIPEAGEKVKTNRRILITINSVLPRKAKAPSLVGFSLRQAKAELASQNFQLGKLTYVYDIATNNVLAQYYNGQMLVPGTPIEVQSTIELLLGVNPEYDITFVPRVSGFTLDMAKDIITDHSLNVGKIVFDASVQTAADSLSAIVVRQSPEASESMVRNMGDEVTLYLSHQAPESDAKREDR